jgi:hypothetical protein
VIIGWWLDTRSASASAGWAVGLNLGVVLRQHTKFCQKECQPGHIIFRPGFAEIFVLLDNNVTQNYHNVQSEYISIFVN